MNLYEQQLEQLLTDKTNKALQVQTFGQFQVQREGQPLQDKDWGRGISLQLFQFFVTARHRGGLHKEVVIDRIWPTVDEKSGNQNFKVALHGINKTLEPHRKSRSEPKYIIRQGLTYQLNLAEIWIDADAIEALIALGNQCMTDYPQIAQEAYRAATELHHGIYLPNRVYEDWSSGERERLQILVLGALVNLAEMLVQSNPLESIRLAQQALLLDDTWEEAYRIQMQAYLEKGNRPAAIKTYQQCERILEEEFGLSPLPATKKVLNAINSR